MSMPKLPEPNPNFTQDQALIMILSSIALEEAALAHIMNAEGEKIQHILDQTHCGDCTANYNNVLEVNKSVTNLLETVQQNQIILKNKLEKVLEYLPKPTCLPDLPGPPKSEGVTPNRMPACFYVVPRIYRCNEPLLWSGKNICCETVTEQCASPKIQLPATGPLLLSFYAELEGAAGFSNKVELVITCQGRAPIRIKIVSNRQPCHPDFFKQTIIELPRACTPCHASIFVRAPQGMRIKQGGFFFARFQADVPGTTR